MSEGFGHLTTFPGRREPSESQDLGVEVDNLGYKVPKQERSAERISVVALGDLL